MRMTIKRHETNQPELANWFGGERAAVGVLSLDLTARGGRSREAAVVRELGEWLAFYSPLSPSFYVINSGN